MGLERQVLLMSLSRFWVPELSRRQEWQCGGMSAALVRLMILRLGRCNDILGYHGSHRLMASLVLPLC